MVDEKGLWGILTPRSLPRSLPLPDSMDYRTFTTALQLFLYKVHNESFMPANLFTYVST